MMPIAMIPADAPEPRAGQSLENRRAIADANVAKKYSSRRSLLSKAGVAGFVTGFTLAFGAPFISLGITPGPGEVRPEYKIGVLEETFERNRLQKEYNEAIERNTLLIGVPSLGLVGVSGLTLVGGLVYLKRREEEELLNIEKNYQRSLRLWRDSLQ